VRSSVPTNQSQLFVSNARGDTGNGTVSAFSVSFTGPLTSIGSSPFADLQTTPCWVGISHDGNYPFAEHRSGRDLELRDQPPTVHSLWSPASRSARRERAPLTPAVRATLERYAGRQGHTH
jgi:hypothetical protein